MDTSKHNILRHYFKPSTIEVVVTTTKALAQASQTVFCNLACLILDLHV